MANPYARQTEMHLKGSTQECVMMIHKPIARRFGEWSLMAFLPLWTENYSLSLSPSLSFSLSWWTISLPVVVPRSGPPVVILR